jgi:hypothetical protein
VGDTRTRAPVPRRHESGVFDEPLRLLSNPRAAQKLIAVDHPLGA